MLAKMPRPLAATPMRWLVRRSLVAAKTSTQPVRSDALKGRRSSRTGRDSNSLSHSGATTVTRAPASIRPLVFRSATLPAPTTNTGRPCSETKIG